MKTPKPPQYPLTPKRLDEIGRWLYAAAPNWRAQLARGLEVSRTAVGYWTAGRCRMSRANVKVLRHMIKDELRARARDRLMLK